MRERFLPLCIAMLMALQSSAAVAQERAVDPKACAPGEQVKPGDGKSPPAATTGENVSDKLARTDGVLCPPNVDPGIKAPTPEVGKMPIIPPPGSPGGDQSVQPK